MWTKLGDEFSDAAQDLTDAAFRTHVEALCWSNRREVELVIAKRDLRRFTESPNASKAVTELIQSGWWRDDGDSYYIGLRYPEWQLTKAQIEARRLKNLRGYHHRNGNHTLCISGKCKSAPDPDSTVHSTDHSTDESTDDSTATPGRVGAVSGRALPGDAAEVDERTGEILDLGEYRGGPVAWKRGSSA